MKIGLLTDLSDDQKIYVNYAYFQFAERFGNVTFVTPFDSEVRNDLDLLILIGGADVHPYRYGQPKIPWQTQNQNTNLEYFDMTLLPKYIEAQVPIFGICRGLQTLNVHFGGTLIQHVEEPNSGMARGKLVHPVYDVDTKTVYGVNSLHHQVIGKLGENLSTTLMSFSKKKKQDAKPRYIEGIRHDFLPIAAVQFHPEELDESDEHSRPTIEWVDDQISEIIAEGKQLKQQAENVTN